MACPRRAWFSLTRSRAPNSIWMFPKHPSSNDDSPFRYLEGVDALNCWDLNSGIVGAYPVAAKTTCFTLEVSNEIYADAHLLSTLRILRHPVGPDEYIRD